MAQTTDRQQTDIATYGMNWPRGRFSKSLRLSKAASLPIQLGHQAVLLFPLLGFLHQRHIARMAFCRNTDNKPNKMQAGQFYIEGKVSNKMNKSSNFSTPTSALKVKDILGI